MVNIRFSKISGYSIFVVFGTFPECEADSLLRLVPAVQTVKPRPLASAKSHTSSSMASSHNKSSEEDLQRAIKLSLGPHENQIELDTDPDSSLSAALQISITSSTAAAARKDNQEDDLQKALHLSLRNHNEDPPSSLPAETTREEDDEAELQKALRLSLQGISPASESDDNDLERALKMSLECKLAGIVCNNERKKEKNERFYIERVSGTIASSNLQ